VSTPAEGLRELAAPMQRGEKTEIVVGRAATASGLPYWRCWNIWFGKARRIEPEESAAIAAAVEHKRRKAERNELHELKLRLARLESRLAITDADFHRGDIEALGHAFAPAGPRGSGRR
jgi:hypothetical protein